MKSPRAATIRNPERAGGPAQASSHSLYIVPQGLGSGFLATIRGHILELANPGSSSDHSLAPTPDDLLIASLASELAWSTRAFLRAHGLPDDVGVAANWRTGVDLSGPVEVALTVTVSAAAEGARTELARLLENDLGARLLDHPRVHISLDEAR
jgi:hypothetical protein